MATTRPRLKRTAHLEIRRWTHGGARGHTDPPVHVKCRDGANGTLDPETGGVAFAKRRMDLTFGIAERASRSASGSSSSAELSTKAEGIVVNAKRGDAHKHKRRRRRRRTPPQRRRRSRRQLITERNNTETVHAQAPDQKKQSNWNGGVATVSYTHLRAHET